MIHKTSGGPEVDTSRLLTRDELARILTLEARVSSLWLIVMAILRNDEPPSRRLMEGERQ
jgi:hypothetical protein